MQQDPNSARSASTQQGDAVSISLPKGGGAIRSIGEKFGTNPATGTGSMQVPLATSAARSGMSPSLNLAYDSGAGNGPFGFGWTLALPAITRKTDKGLPQYDDARDADVFILAGAEDLVPQPQCEQVHDGYRVRRYRPRTEGLFARIERWTRTADPHDVHWRTVSPDNLLTIYGADTASRIADPADHSRIFSWLVCESRDDKGNAIVYCYKEEDGEGANLALASERNRGARNDPRRRANRYIKRILYGNRASLLGTDGERAHFARTADVQWMFEVVFDYGEHDEAAPMPFEARPWPWRRDAFSSYRSGFEQRCARVCRRVLMFHHFPGEPDVGRDCLVRSTDFAYTEATLAAYTCLREVTQTGYRRRRQGYAARSFPPMAFEYSQAEVHDSVHVVDSGAQGAGTLWADLHGEGLPGLLTEQGAAWYYQRNESPLTGAVRFAPPAQVSPKPNLSLLGGQAQLMDLEGDGQPDLVVLSPLGAPGPGLYENDEGGGWQPFRPFSAPLNRKMNDPNVRLIDLDGDGRPDVLVTEDEALVWHPSLGEQGFGRGCRVPLPADEEDGPRLVFANGGESMFLADLSGDGLADLVRIRNREVCYWPNLGYGRFGARIVMDGAPEFDACGQFDYARLRLADIDGSGTADIIYLHADGVRLYFNESGNGWSPARTLRCFPRADSLAEVVPLDLKGNGTACLVWSAPLAAEGRRALRYVDLMGGNKPHLLIKAVNNMGAETHISYAPSTRFYLQDQRDGMPWRTRLPFPVHVVERVEVVDCISASRFVTRYAYHHGYFDGAEREFRGFGMVEQWDSETVAGATDVPPVLTRTWFHTGVYEGRAHVSDFFANQYYREPDTSHAAGRCLLPDSVLPPGLTPAEERQACRALKGAMLRREVYAQDSTGRAAHPYVATQQCMSVRLLQRQGANRHAVFHAHASQVLHFHYERAPADPRIQHLLTLEVDDWGNVLRQAAVGYARRQGACGLAAQARVVQERTLATYTENQVTNAVDTPHAWRAPLACGRRTWEVLGCVPWMAEGLDRLERRLIGAELTLFRRDNLDGLLPPGQLGARALPGEGYQLAMTPTLVRSVFGERVDQAMLAEAGYVHSEDDAGWWMPTGRSFYSPGSDDSAEQELTFARAHFFAPHRYRTPFHGPAHSTETTVGYDAHDLVPAFTLDAMGNRTSAARIDYRVLQPALVVDANGNRSAAAFDILGMVAGTAQMGKEGETLGDTLEGFWPDLREDTLLAHLRDPLADPHAILGRAGTRLVVDLFAYRRSAHLPQPQPAVTYALARETHSAELAPGQLSKVQHSFAYTDGFGREIQKKTRDVRRWVGSGWTVFNNKGNPVRQYEPFFSATPAFEFDLRSGVSPVLFYDPMERVVATLQPNHAWTKKVFAPWHEEDWDLNDTCAIADPAEDPDVGAYFRRMPQAAFVPSWCGMRDGGELGVHEQAAARKSARHGGTPTVTHLDPLARAFLGVAHNRAGDGDQFLATRTVFDIQGYQLALVDPKGRTTMRYDYDLLGTRLAQTSMEAGPRRVLSDIHGKPLYQWDGRGQVVRTTYDALRRPVETWLDARLVGRTTYGEAIAGAQAANLRTRPAEVCDPAGAVTSEAYDFKGNLLAGRRRVATAYRETPDWSAPVALEEASYLGSTSYDALNRPLEASAPDGSVVRHHYNEGGKLERIDARLRGESAWTTFVAHIKYNPNNQRLRIEYGNGVESSYEYDAPTFRLQRMRTRRGAAVQPGLLPESLPGLLQDLRYAYDPVGAIVHIEDAAQQACYFQNRRIDADADYTYDALYRLVEASGREHLGRGSAPLVGGDDAAPQLFDQRDGQALGRYLQRYQYDEAGNLARMAHRGLGSAHAGWSRDYLYQEASLLEPERCSNRLTAVQTGALREQYGAYDEHGSMLRMPHLQQMQWDFSDRLQMTRSMCGEDGERTWYVYDADGQRVRKVTESACGRTREERLYLGGFELYRRYGNDAVVRETLHIMDDQRRIALVETRTEGVAHGEPARLTRYQLGNHLGSSCLELDDQARLISHEEYFPFGGTSWQAVRNAAETPKRYRFSGKERDNETGLNYHGARYYAPWLGRWTSCDPGGLRDGPNLYQYAGNDPVNHVDQNGRWDIDWGEVLIGAGVAILVVGAVVVTAGVAAGPIAAGLATAGLTATEISALGTAVVVVGTGAGVVGTARTVSELSSGVNSETGQPLTDVEGSRRLGALPVEIVATALGARSLGGGGGGSSGLLDPVPSFRMMTPEGISFGGTLAPAAELAPVAVPAATGAGIGSWTPALAMAMMNGEGGGNSSSSSGGRSTPVEEEPVCRPETHPDDLRSVDPAGEPFDPTPNPARYEHPSRRVIDHIQARALKGSPDDPVNLDPKTWEANSRKAGFEGNYLRDLRRYTELLGSRADAEKVLQGEYEYILNDVHASPVDPFTLDELANQVCLPHPLE